MTQISGWVLILCHQSHDFLLKMHHEAFGGRAPDPLEAHSWIYRGWAMIDGKREGVHGRAGMGKEVIPHFFAKRSPLLLLYRHCTIGRISRGMHKTEAKHCTSCSWKENTVPDIWHLLLYKSIYHHHHHQHQQQQQQHQSICSAPTTPWTQVHTSNGKTVKQ